MVSVGPVMLKPNEKLVQKARSSSSDNEANIIVVWVQIISRLDK